MSTIFFTGFPGFVGSALLPRLLARSPDRIGVCLIQSRYAATARRRIARLEAESPELAGRIRLLEGDISKPRLGLRDVDGLAASTTEIHHLAAAYDLEISREVGMRVNVTGTQRIIEFAARCASLDRLHYVSTCYVSGRHAGVFRETELDVGQTFNNHYEETKFLAEQAVQAAMQGGLPATIYRPAIVVGDRLSGATQKYDGPYFIVRFLLRQPRLAVLPVVGDPAACRVTLIPRDSLVAAIDWLAGREVSRGRVYQLADPDPPTVSETIEILAAVMRKRLLRLRLPSRLAGWGLRTRALRRATGIPAALLGYFTQPTLYSVEQAVKDLGGSGLELPTFRSYAESLVSFVEENPDVGAAAMV